MYVCMYVVAIQHLMNLLIYHLEPTDRQIDRWLAPRSPLHVTPGTPPTCPASVTQPCTTVIKL
jgi:hypothetical protein